MIERRLPHPRLDAGKCKLVFRGPRYVFPKRAKILKRLAIDDLHFVTGDIPSLPDAVRAIVIFDRELAQVLPLSEDLKKSRSAALS